MGHRLLTRQWLLTVLAVFMAVSGMAQDDQLRLQLGVRGGVQVTQMSFKSKVLEDNNRAGFFIGPVIKFKTPVVGLGVDVAALYDQRDLKVEGKVMKQKSLVIPAHARLGASIFDKLGIYLFAGPQFCFNVGDDIVHWIDGNGDNKQLALQNTTLSVNIGAGVTIGRHLEASVYYNLPLGKTADFTWSDASQQLQGETWRRAKSSVDAWRLAVTYYF